MKSRGLSARAAKTVRCATTYAAPHARRLYLSLLLLPELWPPDRRLRRLLRPDCQTMVKVAAWQGSKFPPTHVSSHSAGNAVYNTSKTQKCITT